tara:strand:- start:8 stop:1219 length:1212 start_codon:yes stop_codon:yes gene_type:complete
METETYNFTNLTTANLDIEKLKKLNSLEVFSTITCRWLSDLSRFLLKDPKTKKYPDVATFAFFCRKANLSKLKVNHTNPNQMRIGKGIAFHIAPSNVPVNFAYTLISGLLAGNINIVKIPSKYFEQIDIIVNAINKTLENSEFEEVKKRIFVIKYDTNSETTSIISKICDLRIIWGGNETVSNIKNIKLNPKSLDISFPDRYSICLINAKEYLELKDKNRLSESFYNDTYLFDQNACTAPHSIFWVGSDQDVEKSKTIFWDLLEKTINEKQYNLNDISTIDKLVTFYSQSMDEVSISKINKNNLIWRVNNKELSLKVDDFRCASGYFNEFKINHIDELNDVIRRNYQTLSYFGINKLDFINFFKTKRPLGIDRVVPIGKTLDFSLNWDGYDLINQMSRLIDIK